MDRLGDVLVSQGDLSGAQSRYEEGLKIARELLSRDAGNTRWRRDILVSMWRLRQFPDSGIGWTDLSSYLEQMDEDGVLFPSDRKFLELAKQRASEE